MLATDFGLQHKSCREAMEWRRSLGPDATQADAWRQCYRGDWMIWQLKRIDRPVPREAIIAIVARAIRRGQRSLRGVRAPWATEWRRWARRWLSGEDRTRAAADAASAGAGGWAAGTAGGAEAALAWAAWTAADAALEAAALAGAAAESAMAAARTAAKTELRLQARDLRLVLPEWPVRKVGRGS